MLGFGMANIYALMKEVLNMEYKQTKKQNQRILRITNETSSYRWRYRKEIHAARKVDFRGSVHLSMRLYFFNIWLISL